jgi:hypothetical protein
MVKLLHTLDDIARLTTPPVIKLDPVVRRSEVVALLRDLQTLVAHSEKQAHLLHPSKLHHRFGAALRSCFQKAQLIFGVR